jgi:hypothetical protein
VAESGDESLPAHVLSRPQGKVQVGFPLIAGTRIPWSDGKFFSGPAAGHPVHIRQNRLLEGLQPPFQPNPQSSFHGLFSLFSVHRLAISLCRMQTEQVPEKNGKTIGNARQYPHKRKKML